MRSFAPVWRHVSIWVALLLAITSPTLAAEPGPGEELLRLAPPDAGATLIVEDVRGHVRSFFDSPLAEGLANVPAVKDWWQSPAGQRLDLARKDIESALGITLKAVRDDLLGDAVLLAIQADPRDDPRQPHGLLLTRSRNRALLDRLIGVLNLAEKNSGDLVEVASQDLGSLGTYYHRRFRPGTKADSWYAIVGDATFAWSNSEALIRGVLDRRAGKLSGLDTQVEATRVRSGLPNKAVATLLIDPGYISRVLEADSAPGQPGGTPQRLRAYVKAMKYLGLALEWRDGMLALHAHAVYDPAKVPEPHRRWAARPIERALASMPADGLALVSIPVDFGAVADILFNPVPGQDRTRLDNTLTAVNGLLLGRDLRREILPGVDPHFRLLVRNPGRLRGPLPIAMTAPMSDPSVGPAIENAIRTILAFRALGPEHGGRVETLELQGVRLTTLAGPPPRLSVSVDRGRISFGNSPEAVLWSLDQSREPRVLPAHEGFEDARARFFPDQAGFAFLDINSWVSWARLHRPAIIAWLARGRDEPILTAGRDLDNTLALGSLFRSAFATGSVTPGFEEAHLRLGLVVKGAKGEK